MMLKETFEESSKEPMEDLALGRAIEEGLNTPEVEEEEVFRLLRKDEN